MRVAHAGPGAHLETSRRGRSTIPLWRWPAQPGAAGLAGPGLVGAVEAVEHVGQAAGVDALALVLDGEAGHAVPQGGGQGDVPSGGVYLMELDTTFIITCTIRSRSPVISGSSSVMSSSMAWPWRWASIRLAL